MNWLFDWAWGQAVAGKTGWLTRVFWWWIPFNKPHRFRIVSLWEGCAEVQAPNRRWNRNHLGTMHACSLATIGEYAAGLALLGAFKPADFRLIMSRLEVDYVRRAQGAICSKAELTHSDLEAVRSSLSAEGVTQFTVTSVLTDSGGELVATARTQWQVKAWSKVQSSSQPAGHR